MRHTHGSTFYHTGPLPPIPSAVHQLRINKREGGEGVRVWVDGLNGLLGLLEMDVVEVHPWAATIADIERPDRLIFDIEPGPGVPWEFVIETALNLRAILDQEGRQSWPKLTGGKDLHVTVPVAPCMPHDEAREYCRNIAQRLASMAPDKYITSAALERRNGRIYLDYLRNGRGSTAIGPFSPRALKGFPIAAPVTWKQVEKGIKPDAYT